MDTDPAASMSRAWYATSKPPVKKKRKRGKKKVRRINLDRGSKS